MNSCYFLFALLFLTKANKFLFYETAFARSHLQFAGKLIDVLVENGHTVDVLVLQYNPDISTNGTQKFRKLHRINPKNGKESYWMKMPHFGSPFEKRDMELVKYFQKSIVQFCDALMSDDSLIESLKSENYDAGFTMVYENCPFGLFHVLNIKPVIGFVATALPNMISDVFKLPSAPSYVLNVLRNPGRSALELTFFDRLSLFTAEMKDHFINIPKANAIQTEVFTAKYGKDFPDLAQLKAEMSIVFVNSEKVLDAARPLTHKIEFIGGIQSQTAKPLPKEFQEIYDHSQDGVILFSFGSLFKTSDIPEHVKHSFLKSFAKFPRYTIIWKYDNMEEDAEMFRNYSNVVPTKWMPQYDLLSNKRTKVFITHLGQNSYLEVANAGTPVIAVPLFVDQLFNGAMAMEKGLGVSISRFNLTEKSITEALNEVLSNPKYRLNAKQISKMLRTQPFTARDIFVKNVEYLVENSEVGSHYQLPSVHMPFWKEHSLDVIGFVAACTLLLVYTLIYIVSRISQLYSKKSKCD
ncbi:hypothetical protein L596_010880 [Steinernema carpocapsae]|uniref:glucuronosyltransferase n=1 Tax=Steinernema carpocapsae TaxID=34508 RepID=A0A4V6A778_STECR|nr:hypothetical protein L596_010880 [Steinernema carpocapsae]